MNYLRFWKDLAGEYLFASSDNYHVLSRAFLTNDVVYVLLHNNHRDEQRAEVRLSLPPDTEVQQAELKMLFQNHQDLGFQDYAPVASLADIPLPSEATAILRLKLNQAPALPLYFEDNYYGNKVLENITANVLEEFTIDVAKPLDHAFDGGRLHFSLHKNGGFAYNPVEIRVNGFRLRTLPDIRHSAGVVNCWKQFQVDVPAALLAQGTNTVALRFPQEGGRITSVRLAVVSRPTRLVLRAEAAANAAGAPAVRLRFPTTRGRWYEIQRSARLTGPQWETVAVVPGNGREATVTDDQPGPAFYRLRVTAESPAP